MTNDPSSLNWGLVGHAWAVDMLKQQIVHDMVRHAYLLTGPPGIGHRTLALRFTQALNCPKPTAIGEPCQVCKTCRQIEAMQYPDLAVIQSGKDGGVLKVDQVRTLQQSLSLKPFQGKYRVALFLRFQEANPTAANALLKTLEEAPAQVILLLTADNAGQLLPTIVSRCEILRLRPPSIEMVEAFLISHGADPTTSRLLAHISGGRPGVSLYLLQHKEELKFYAGRLNDLQILLGTNRRRRFAYAEKLTDRKSAVTERFRDTLFVWLAYWRDVLLCATRSDTPIANLDRTGEIKLLAEKLSLPEARRLVSETVEAIERLEKNVNTRLLAEVLLLDWPRVG